VGSFYIDYSIGYSMDQSTVNKRKQLLILASILASTSLGAVVGIAYWYQATQIWQLQLMIQVGWPFPLLYSIALAAIWFGRFRLGLWLMALSTAGVLPVTAAFIPEISPAFGLSIALFLVLGGSRFFNRTEIWVFTVIAVVVTLTTLVISLLELPTQLENPLFRTSILGIGTGVTIILVIMSVAEVLRRTQTESRLAISESRLRMITDNSPDVFWLANADESEFAYLSPGFERLTGYGAEALRQDPGRWIDLLDDTDRTLITRARNSSTQVSQDIVEFETQITMPEGKKKWVLVRTAPMFDTAGNLVARTGFISDISRQKAAESDLIASQAQLKLTLDTLSDAVFVLDSDGDFVEYYRPAGPARFPIPDDVQGKNIRDLLPDETALELERVIQFVQATQESRHMVISFETRTEMQWFDVGVSPRAGGTDGAGMGVTLIARDITEQVDLESISQRYAAELVEKNTDLDAFAHTVAHDLKNSLTKIFGYSELLEAELLASDAESKKFVGQIMGSSQKMAEIIDALLFFAKVRKSEFEPVRLDMESIVDEALVQLSRLIQEKGAQVHLPDFWPTVSGHPGWIENVWINYISNGIKYGGQPPHVELGSDILTDRVEFWVKDNGPGLDALATEGLFEEWSRLGGSQEPGHGLGLSIVRRIIKKSGGEVGVESKPGHGSRFYFSLPTTD
jgi:PAS domain S-box-containing protein